MDVLEDLWQDEVNENKFLKDVLDYMHVDEKKLRIIKKRLDKHNDDMSNACRAADVEPKGRRIRKEARS